MKYWRIAFALGFAVVLGLTTGAQAAPVGGHSAGVAGHPGFSGHGPAGHPGLGGVQGGPPRAAAFPGHPGEFHGHQDFHDHAHFHGHAFVGVAPFVFAPGFVYEPPVVIPPQPEYVPGSDGYWYYCQSAGAYYPNVPSCPEPWIPVPAS